MTSLAAAMSQGAMLVWFSLTALSVVFVAVDVRHTPAHPVLKLAFVILTAFIGPFGAFFYVLGCREPLERSHEFYVAARWRQVLGSTMHCAAGDGLGIVAGAAIAAQAHLPGWAHLSLEYALGFGFGWTIFQALAMRGMAGGSYSNSLAITFYPEFVSMNFLMAGMVVAVELLRPLIAGASLPSAPGFWFVMSLALLVGFAFAYPINWWLVARHLKHGMITVRPESESIPSAAASIPDAKSDHESGAGPSGRMTPTTSARTSVALLSLAALAISIAIARMLASSVAAIR